MDADPLVILFIHKVVKIEIKAGAKASVDSAVFVYEIDIDFFNGSLDKGDIWICSRSYFGRHCVVFINHVIHKCLSKACSAQKKRWFDLAEYTSHFEFPVAKISSDVR